MGAGNGMAMMLLPLCTTFASLSTFAAVCGLFGGGRAGVLTLVCCQLFGQKLASRAYAMLCIAFMFSQTVGSPAVGYIYDRSGSYEAGFVVVGALMLLGFVLCVWLECRRMGNAAASEAHAPPKPGEESSKELGDEAETVAKAEV